MTVSKYLELAQILQEDTVKTRRMIHQNPELGFQEINTANLIAGSLRSAEIEFKQGIARTGIVAQIDGKKDQPVGAIRFDMDALPIQEDTGLEYSSLRPGVMHACGHDGHTAIGLTVCKILQTYHHELPGSIRCIFQPAEEGDGGAKQMVQENVLENPKPDFILGMHLWNEKPVGWIGLTSGPVMAASDIFEIKILGKGGHGGNPAQTNDPIVCAAQIALGLQTISSRNLSAFEQAVLSITSINGGTTHNVIPEEVILKGTIRTFEKSTQAKIHARMKDVCENIATANGCKAILSIKAVTPTVINNERITELVKTVVQKEYPEMQIDSRYQTTISEDMAFYMERIPGCFILLGSSNAAKGKDFAHHHPKFDFDEQVMTTAVGLISDACFHILSEIK